MSLATSLVSNSSSGSGVREKTERLLDLASSEEELKIWSTYNNRRSKNPSLPPPLIQGKSIEYQNMAGFSLPGLEITNETKVDKSRLKLERAGRASAAGVGSLLSVGATLGLFYSGAKTLTSLVSGGDQDEANSASSKAFGIAAAAGVGTALAQENANWGFGALGMGLLGGQLDKLWGASLFSAADALNAIGMGQVKLRDNKNVIDLEHSIFDNTFLEPFKDRLQNYEYAVKTFWNKFTSKSGWKNISSDEPYDLYYAAGGGLLSGSAFLGVASVFSSWMSEKVKSLFYIPYSMTSLVNLVALYRDGQVMGKRANAYNDMIPTEKKTTIIEGWAKSIASPILALNYGILGLKGLGLNLFGASETLAKSLRQFGVGIAYIGFAAQSGVKLFISDHWGPKVKNIFNVALNPEQIVKYLKGLINEVTVGEDKTRKYHEVSDFFYPQLMSDEHKDLYERTIQTDFFQNLKNRHLTGLPSEMALERAFLERFTHSIRAGGIACDLVDDLKNNTEANNKDFAYLFADPAFSLSLKYASLIHDTGHSKLPRCHLAETAYPMAKDANDHLSIEALEQGHESGFHDLLINYCNEKYGSEGSSIGQRTIKNIKAILGHKPFEVITKDSSSNTTRKDLFKWEYKPATDMADYMRSKGSDYDASFGVKPWGKAEYDYFANQRVLFKDNSGVVRAGYTEEGAVIAFKHLYLRLIFNAFLNAHPATLAVESAYKAGARQVKPKMTLERLYALTDPELDELAEKFVTDLKTKSKQPIRNVFGGTKAYAGYGPKDTIYVVKEDGKPEEFLHYYEHSLKREHPEVYEAMKHMVEVTTNPAMVEIILNFDPSFDNSAKFKQEAKERKVSLPEKQQGRTSSREEAAVAAV